MSKPRPNAEELARLSRIQRKQPSDFCFVIMSFSENPILQSYYEEAVKPTITDLGLRCIRIDEEDYPEPISDRIKKNIVECRIVIVDLTEDRPNCYFEAGYAVAVGKPMIFQRLNAPKYEARFHFDVKDYPHILYGTISDLKKRLGERLYALLQST